MLPMPRLWHLRAKGNDPVIPAFTPIDDTREVGRGIDKQEEVVADQFHLINGLLGGHHLGFKDLAPNHHRGFFWRERLNLLVVNGRNTSGCDTAQYFNARRRHINVAKARGSELTQALGALAAVMHQLLIFCSAQALNEMVQRLIKGSVMSM